MKKIILTYCLLAFSLTSFSQQEIENWSHPFQVLFVDSTNLIGENKQISQFDFLSKYDLLEVKGNITLVHFTGKIVELNNLKLKVKDLAEIHHKEGYFERPIISDPTKFKNESTNYRMRLDPLGPVRICYPQQLRVVYPTKEQDQLEYHLFKGEELFIVWECDIKLNKNQYFQVKLVDIFDRLLFIEKTLGKSILIPSNKIVTETDLLVLEVSIQPEEDQTTGQQGIYLHERRERKNMDYYSGIFASLTEDWTRSKTVADFFYQKAIENSNQDPRFIQLYEDFLGRNPEFVKPKK
jgi:hypothetical protein